MKRTHPNDPSWLQCDSIVLIYPIVAYLFYLDVEHVYVLSAKKRNDQDFFLMLGNAS